MNVNVTPLHDRILVTRIKAKDMAKSGIIISDTAKEKPRGRSGWGRPQK